MLLKNLCSSCDVCGEEKKTELFCWNYRFNDELEDSSIIKESCWSICDECCLSLNQKSRS